MPKLSADTLLQRAIEPAVGDRMSLSDAYPRNQPEHRQFREEAERIRKLQGKKFKDLTEAERKTAFGAFLAAEQWEESLADANHMKGPIAEECMRNVRLFREFRVAERGRTRLEVDMSEATSVDIRELLDKKPATKATKAAKKAGP